MCLRTTGWIGGRRVRNHHGGRQWIGATVVVLVPLERERAGGGELETTAEGVDRSERQWSVLVPLEGRGAGGGELETTVEYVRGVLEGRWLMLVPLECL